MIKNKYLYILPIVVVIIIIIFIYIIKIFDKNDNIKTNYIVGKTDTTKITKVVDIQKKEVKTKYVNKENYVIDNKIVLDSIETEWTSFVLEDTLSNTKTIGKIKIKDSKFMFDSLKTAFDNIILSRVDLETKELIKPFYENEFFYISIITILLIILLL